MRLALCFMLASSATVSAAGPPVRAWAAHQDVEALKADVSDLKSRVAALEAQPPVPQPAPAAALPPAPTSVSDAATYSACVRQTLTTGGRIVLIVGPAALSEYAEHTEPFRVSSGYKGIADGVYDCVRENGVARFTQRGVVTVSAPATVAAPTYQFAPQTYYAAPAFGSPCANGRCPTAR